MASIKARILLTITLLGLTAILGCIAIGYTAYRIGQEKDAVVRSSLDAINAADGIRRSADQARTLLEDVIAMTRLVDMGAQRGAFLAKAAALDIQVQNLEAAALSPEMAASIASFKTERAAWLRDARVLLGITAASEVPTVELIRRDAWALETHAASIAILANSDAGRFIAQAEARMTRSLAFVGTGVLAILLVVAGFAIVSARRLSRSIITVADRLRRMAGIDVDRLGRSRNEISQMTLASELLESELAAFQSSLGHAARRAAAGDLSVRVAETASQEDLRAIAVQLNQVFTAMETATQATSDVLRAFAEGDLGARVEGDYSGVFADLQRDGNATGDKLFELVSQIKATADSIQAELLPIHSGARDLSQRAAAQAERLRDTAATMAHLAMTVQANAENAARASTLSDGTSGAALQGGKVASEAIAAIRLVSDSARQITEITGYVDDIAFQTNLLSLNAAVEAARAGDVGKGFAVVAHEVRMLAVKAAEASQEIKGLITQSTRQVGNGVKFVEATGASLTEIHAAVAQVVAAIGQITQAVQHQSAAIGAVSGTLSGLEHETGLNARLALDSVSAVDGLTGQIARLNQLVAFFRITAERPPLASAEFRDETAAARRLSA